MIKLRALGKITCDNVSKIYERYPNEKIVIVMPNTRDQNSETIRKVGMRYPNISFSVIGGLDPKKEKYNCAHYQKRTYYSAMELSEIISIYEENERGIDLNWTETQKAMFVYKMLCERMQYGTNFINGKDYSRQIGGILHNKAICTGISLIFKEAMDRLGIECYYQVKEDDHAWNIAKLDGKYRALDLTWDIVRKENGVCGFLYFGRSEDFYSNKHHDISNEKEEKEFSITAYTIEELRRCKNIITRQKKLDIPTHDVESSINETCELELE